MNKRVLFSFLLSNYELARKKYRKMFIYVENLENELDVVESAIYKVRMEMEIILHSLNNLYRINNIPKNNYKTNVLQNIIRNCANEMIKQKKLFNQIISKIENAKLSIEIYKKIMIARGDFLKDAKEFIKPDKYAY